MLTEFDRDKFFVGKLCRRKHLFEFRQNSLRYLTDNSCVQCRAHTGKGYKHPVRTEGLIDGKYYLGALCKGNHNYQETGQTLRGANSRQCVECLSAYGQKWRPSGELVGDIYILGSLCKRNHHHEGEDLTLRYANSGACVECSITEHKKKRDVKAEKREAARLADLSYCDSLLLEAGLDTNRFKLAKLCPKDHNWNKTGKSLRYRFSSGCRQCDLEEAAQYYQKHKESYLARRANYYKQNQERLLAQKRDYYQRNKERKLAKDAEYRANNKEKIKIRNQNWSKRNELILKVKSKEYYRQNRSSILTQKSEYQKLNRYKLRERWNKWRSTPQGKICDNRSKAKRKALKLSNHHAPYLPEQWLQRLEKFNYCCAYCGKLENLAQDHFISLNSGGCDTLGNLIPSCQSCNSSKSIKDPYEWFVSKPFYSKKRWQLILQTLGKTQDNYLQLPLF